jgi:hypothetical protein
MLSTPQRAVARCGVLYLSHFSSDSPAIVRLLPAQGDFQLCRGLLQTKKECPLTAQHPFYFPD